MPQETSERAALAARLGVTELALTVTAVAELSPSMLRVDLAGESLVGLSHRPGQDLMLEFSTDAGHLTRRRYTIRRLDPVAGTAELNVVRHGDGPAARWVAQAAAGARLDGLGPRGKVWLDPEASGHILAGDETFIPAALAMAEAAPAGTTVQVVLEVAGAADELPGPLSAADVRLQWVHRGDQPVGASRGLVDALAALGWPPEPVAAYLGGERQVMLAMRDALLRRGLAKERIAGKAYWRLDMANADHGEPLQV